MTTLAVRVRREHHVSGSALLHLNGAAIWAPVLEDRTGHQLPFSIATGTATSGMLTTALAFTASLRGIVSHDDGFTRCRLEAVAQERWFLARRGRLARDFGGQYVAISGDSVVDHDSDLSELVSRFFSERGTVGVFFGFVGDEPPAVVGATAREG